MIQVIPHLDVRESCQAAPHHSVAWRAVVASVEIAAEPGEPVEDIAHGPLCESSAGGTNRSSSKISTSVSTRVAGSSGSVRSVTDPAAIAVMAGGSLVHKPHPPIMAISGQILQLCQNLLGIEKQSLVEKKADNHHDSRERNFSSSKSFITKETQ